jgi:multidrug efflux system outer membrane protein
MIRALRPPTLGGLTVILLLASTGLAGCTLAPAYEKPALPVTQTWPAGLVSGETGASAADIAWRDVYRDDRLRSVIDLALTQNRDLRVAVLNIDRARAQYRIQRAQLLPTLDASVGGSRSRTPGELSGTGSAVEGEQYSAGLGVTAYELDLFGRVRSLNEAALQTYLATAQNRRTVQISLIAQVAGAYLSLAADQELLALSQDTLKSRDDALILTGKRVDAGAANQLELRQAQTLSEQARGDVAAYQAQVQQDANLLRLLVGTEVPADLLPTGALASIAIRTDLPAGLPSDVLTRRPDVLAAEHDLRGMNANIGAARAAFFPRITLTGSAGSASTDLSGLFGGGTGAWSFAPAISLPIFDGGANAANLGVAKADQKIAVARYEKAIQTAFREVADALAVKSTIDDRLAAQTRLVAAAADSERLSRLRYAQGVDSYLTLLDAQRTLYSARQGLISLKLVQASNLTDLYKALGGGAPA